MSESEEFFDLMIKIMKATSEEGTTISIFYNLFAKMREKMVQTYFLGFLSLPFGVF